MEIDNRPKAPGYGQNGRQGAEMPDTRPGAPPGGVRSVPIGEPMPPTRTINMSELGNTLARVRDPAVELLFVYNCNPVATAPDQRLVIDQLCREDLFVVVHDQVMTDSARLADIVLPATAFLEHRDLRRGYGTMRLFDSPAPLGSPAGAHQVYLRYLGPV